MGKKLKLPICVNLPGKYKIVDAQGKVYAEFRILLNARKELKKLSRLLLRDDLSIKYN